MVQCKKLATAAVAEEVEDVSDEDEAADMPDEQVKEEVRKQRNTEGSKKQKLAQELSDCVVICQSVSFKSFKESREKCLWNHCFNLF